jgi:hypothetical protein
LGDVCQLRVSLDLAERGTEACEDAGKRFAERYVKRLAGGEQDLLAPLHSETK